MLALPIFLTACGGGAGSSSNTATKINGIVVPPAPDPVINNATLAGVDSNNNGVRDDVERKIAQTAADSGSFQKTIKAAAGYQKILTTTPSKAELLDIYGDVNCAQLENSQLSEKSLLQAVFNNSGRLAEFNTKTEISSGYFSDELKNCN